MTEIARGTAPDLRDFTPARVSLPTTGNSITTDEVLQFSLAHAQARDAVHAALHAASFAQRMRSELSILGDVSADVIALRTNAHDRAAYLRQPHLGRTLDVASSQLLQRSAYDLSITVVDGLSALAVERNAIAVLAHLLPSLVAEGWRLAPITVVEQGRVGVGDAIGPLLGARLGLVLIGERPGLSSPDSLGAYLTWEPCAERSDADRNCLSNIREGGLSPEIAAARLHWYLQAARTRQYTGVLLKEGAVELVPSSAKIALGEV